MSCSQRGIPLRDKAPRGAAESRCGAKAVRPGRNCLLPSGSLLERAAGPGLALLAQRAAAGRRPQHAAGTRPAAVSVVGSSALKARIHLASSALMNTNRSLPAATRVRLLVATAPAAEANELAHRLVEERLAACVNLVPGVRSVYRWKGSLQTDEEVLLLVKTTAERAVELRRRLVELHSYDVPEVLSFAVEDGHPDYLEWVLASVASARSKSQADD